MYINPKIKEIVSHTDIHIKGFFGDYRWLSNFEPCNVEYEGLLYPSTESAYQAAKTLDLEKRKEFSTITPNEAKKLGRKLIIREDWDDIKIAVMIDVCEYKFFKNKESGEKLKQTGHKYLEETNYWNDTFWGVCNGKGHNNLGKILMAIRIQL